jgi:hypothetical protein
MSLRYGYLLRNSHKLSYHLWQEWRKNAKILSLMRRRESKRRWKDEAGRVLKAELVRRDVDYSELERRLKANGIHESYAAIANKVSRGSFSFAFFLQCMNAIGCRQLVFDWENTD